MPIYGAQLYAQPHPGHFGPELPVVYRWAYAYGVPGAPEDFVAQNVPPDPVAAGGGGREELSPQPAE